MQLTGKQFQQLQEALRKLKQMVRFGLEENLDAIASGTALRAIATGENHEDVVFNLINWTETNGKLENLLIAARNEDCGGNPGNPQLKRICEELLQPTPQEIPFASSVGSRDLNQSFTWKRGSSSSSIYSLTPSGVLSITAGAGTDIVGSVNTAPLVTYPFNGDFGVQVKVMFNSTINNQRAGLGIRSIYAHNHLRIYKLESLHTW